jgi:hypothetical protein
MSASLFGNSIDIVVRAIDKFTMPMNGIVARAKGQAMSLAGISNSGATGLVGQALFGASVGATMAAIAAVTGGVALLTRELNRAADIEVEVIGKSHDIAKNMGITPEKGRGIYNTVESELARLAGPLPGSTSDYTGVFNQIAGGLSRAVPDQKEFERLGVDISKRVGVLAMKSGADPAMGGSAINRAILGTSGLGELRQIDIFQKSDVGVAITDELAKLGKEDKDWKSLTAALRVKVLENALLYATPDAMITEMSSSAAATVEGWMSSLFDPLVGAFGTRRFVESRGKSALDAYTEFIQALDYLFTSFSRATGLDKFDPMAHIIDFIDWLTGLANKLSRMIDMGFDLGDLKNVGHGIGFYVGEFIGQIFKAIPLVLLNLDKIGVFLWGIFTGFFDGLEKALWESIGMFWEAFVDWLKDILKFIEDKLLGWLPGYKSKLDDAQVDPATGKERPALFQGPTAAGMGAGAGLREWVIKQVTGNPSQASAGNSYTVNVEANGITDPDTVANRMMDRLTQALRSENDAQLAT